MMTLHDDRQMGLDEAPQWRLPNAYCWMNRNHLNLPLKLRILFAETIRSVFDEIAIISTTRCTRNHSSIDDRRSTIDLPMVKENAIGFWWRMQSGQFIHCTCTIAHHFISILFQLCFFLVSFRFIESNKMRETNSPTPKATGYAYGIKCHWISYTRNVIKNQQ